MPSIAAAEAQLRADNLPVLLLDTCILLDVIRASFRCLGVDYVRRATELHGLLLTAPPGCALVVASMVPGEWNDNATNVRDEVQRHLVKIQDQALHFHAACNAMGIRLGYGLPAYPVANLPNQLFDLSRQILNFAIRLDSDGGCAARGEVSGGWSPSCRPPDRAAR